ncbi:MAG: thermonuclease family protein, partial [Desulfobaccales bacterium]
KEDATKEYLKKYLLNKTVILKDIQESNDNGLVSGYVYLKNRIFINAYLIKSGLASPDETVSHRYANKFRRLAEEARKPA